MKHNIIRSLVNKGATVKVVPYNYDFSKDLMGDYHGLFISNGPGDPSQLTATIENLRKALDIGTRIPSFLPKAVLILTESSFRQAHFWYLLG